MAIQTSHGTTVAFTIATTFVPKILGVSTSPVEEINDVDATHFGVTGHREYIPGQLMDPGEVTIRYLYEGNRPPVAALDTITITFKDNGTLVGTGYFKSFGVDGDTGDDGPQEAEFTFRFDGKTGPTVTPPV